MTVLPVILTSTVKHLHHWLRKSAYDNMSHQASDWAPGKAHTAKPVCNEQPIKLDFNIPKKSRLSWSYRTIKHLPHLAGRTFSI